MPPRDFTGAARSMRTAALSVMLMLCQLMPARAMSVAPPTPAAGSLATYVVRAVDLYKSHTGEKGNVLSGVEVTIPRGSRLALVGKNGCGKSTLMRCLSGESRPDAGEVDVAKGARVIFVDQEPPPADERAVVSALFSGSTPKVQATRRYLEASARAEEDPKGFEAALARMDEEDAWEVETAARAACERLRVSHLLTRSSMVGLSGGERKRISLAAAIAEARKGDCLLLDEPTNHLDVEAVEWLADLLDAKDGLLHDIACVTVTHDRFFLERASEGGMLELEDGRLHLHSGVRTWASFVDRRAERVAVEAQQAAEAAAKLRREAEWAKRQPKARESKSRSRMEAFEELKEDVNERKNREKNNFAVLDLGAAGQSQRLGGFVAEVQDLSLRRPGAAPEGDAPVLLEGLDLTLSPGDAVGIVGPNGAGKTTLLKALAGASDCTEVVGGRVLLGSTVVVGYYEQSTVLPKELAAQRVLQYIMETVTTASKRRSTAMGAANGGAPVVVSATPQEMADIEGAKAEAADDYDRERADEASESAGGAMSEPEAMALLRRFGFPPSKCNDRLGELSGGERKRLQLLTMLATGPNLLLLDEVTNDIDLWTAAALENWLRTEFRGALVCISHDRAFMDNCVKRLLVLKGAGQTPTHDFFGDSFSAYLEMTKAKEAMLATQAAPAKRAPRERVRTAKDPKKDRKLRQEYEKILPEIERLQGRLAEAEAELDRKGAEGVGYSELQDLTEKTAAIAADIEAKEERWMELAEIFEDDE